MKLVRCAVGREIAYGVLEGEHTIRRLLGSPFESLAAGAASWSLDQVLLLAPEPSAR